MLQLCLRCGLISGSMLCGWAGMFWVGISGITFRNFLGRLLCRLRLLWGEFLFYFLLLVLTIFCGVGFSVFLLLLVAVVYLMAWFLLRFVLISAISIFWWWFSVLKCFFVVVYFCWTIWSAVRLLALIYMVWGFSNGCALVSSKFPWDWWLGSG